MMIQTIAYLDCQSGFSAEMLLAALLDVGLSLDTLRQHLAALPLSGYQLRQASVYEKGLAGLRVSIFREEQARVRYSLAEIISFYQASSLPSQVRERSLTVLRRLVEAEAAVERRPDNDDARSLALEDVVAVTAVVLALDILRITTLSASPLPLTSGHRQTEQGFLPIPAPVTLELLCQVNAPWKPCPVELELVTPVGAALLATLARFDAPMIVIERTGYGFGDTGMVLPWPTCLRLCLGKAYGISSALSDAEEVVESDWVTVLETHIDNMSGELLGGLMERLFSSGALDVSYTPMLMKKNRPATLIRIICRPEDGENLALLLLRESSTLGVRTQQMQRRKAQRFPQQITTPLGSMLVKVKRLGSRIISATPEYEECQRLAREHDLPLVEVYQVAQEAIRATILHE
jgi:uncharacterized protein (TIGR00299 family) protein